MLSGAKNTLIHRYAKVSRHDLLPLICLPLITSVLLAVVWIITLSKLAHDYQTAERMAFRQAASLANSYAVQLQHIVGQIDQLTRSIAFTWQDAPTQVDLARDERRGLFPRSHDFFVFILDDKANAVRISFRPKQRRSLHEAAFFIAHKQNCCLGLLVSPLEYGPLIGQQVICFSRRLNGPDGSFRGVVAVSVAPDFLATFQDEALQGRGDFVSVRLDYGPLLATKLGRGIKEKRIFYRIDPVFSTPRGAALEAGEKFKDGRTRYVAWRKVADYPLVALAAMTQDDALLSYQALASSYRTTAAVASALLIALALVAVVSSAKLASRRRAEEAVRITYRMATDAAKEGFYMLRPVLSSDGVSFDFRIEDCNERAAFLLGTSRKQLLGTKASDIVVDGQHTDLVRVCRKALADGVYEDELRVPPHSWLKASWAYLRAVHSGSGIALTIRDISEAKAHEQALADLANHDVLTKLPNRRWLAGFLPDALRRAARGRGKLALFFIDLDNFKQINDVYGHEAGDALLVTAAARILSAVRVSDHVARLGGDEFTVVLEQTDRVGDIAKVAESILKSLGEPFTLKAGVSKQVSASIGIALYPTDGADAGTMLKHADIAMYAAKGAGKGRYHFYGTAA